MSDLADKIRELKATKQFSDVDLHQMAEVMSYAKPEENYQRLKVLLLAGQPLVSREEALGLVAAPSVEILGADFVNDVKLLDEFAYHDDECGKLTMPNPCTCGLQPIRDRIFEKLRLWHAAERRMKRGSGSVT